MRSFRGIFLTDKPGNVSVCSAIITIILCHMLRLEQFSFLHYCYSVVYSGIAICLIDKQMMRCLEMDRKIATTKPKIPPPFCAESKKNVEHIMIYCLVMLKVMGLQIAREMTLHAYHQGQLDSIRTPEQKN